MTGGCGVGVGLDLGEHFREGFDASEIDVELGLAGTPQVGVGVVEAGKEEGAGVCRVEVVEDGLGAGEAGDFVVGADGENFAAADGDGLDGLRFVVREAVAGVNDAVEEDDVGGDLGRRWGHGATGGAVMGGDGLCGSERGREKDSEMDAGWCAHARSLADELLLGGPLGDGEE